MIFSIHPTSVAFNGKFRFQSSSIQSIGDSIRLPLEFRSQAPVSGKISSSPRLINQSILAAFVFTWGPHGVSICDGHCCTDANLQAKQKTSNHPTLRHCASLKSLIPSDAVAMVLVIPQHRFYNSIARFNC